MGPSSNRLQVCIKTIDRKDHREHFIQFTSGCNAWTSFLVSESDLVDPYGKHCLASFFRKVVVPMLLIFLTPDLRQRIPLVISLHVCAAVRSPPEIDMESRVRISLLAYLLTLCSEKPQRYFGKVHRRFIASSWQSFTQASIGGLFHGLESHSLRSDQLFHPGFIPGLSPLAMQKHMTLANCTTSRLQIIKD